MISYMPYCNRATRRRIERYRKKHSGLTFTQAYNRIFCTNYPERDNINEPSTTDLSNNRKK